MLKKLLDGIIKDNLHEAPGIQMLLYLSWLPLVAFCSKWPILFDIFLGQPVVTGQLVCSLSGLLQKFYQFGRYGHAYTCTVAAFLLLFVFLLLGHGSRRTVCIVFEEKVRIAKHKPGSKAVSKLVATSRIFLRYCLKRNGIFGHSLGLSHLFVVGCLILCLRCSLSQRCSIYG